MLPPALPHLSIHLQARYLRELNQGGNHEAVIQLFESGRLMAPEAVMAEYVTALARTNRLDNSRLLQTLQVRMCAWLHKYEKELWMRKGLPGPWEVPLGWCQSTACLKVFIGGSTACLKVFKGGVEG